jgi:hypothetical protein
MHGTPHEQAARISAVEESYWLHGRFVTKSRCCVEENGAASDAQRKSGQHLKKSGTGTSVPIVPD